MSIDASAVARVLGVETVFKDLRAAGSGSLPQRIAVFAQGSSNVTYSEEKWPAPSAADAASRFGFGCPIHLILRQLKPVDGDGIGTIPVDVFPLPNPSGGGAAAAAGSIIPQAGTASATGTYRVRVSGILSQAFAIPLGTINVSEVIGRMGDAISAVLHMPVNVAYTYSAVTSTPKTNTGNGTLTALSVPGGNTPRPGAYSLVCNTAVAQGGVFTLTDPNGTVISTSVTMTPGSGGATPLTVGGLAFTLTDGSTDFAVGDGFTITVPATALGLTAKWKGASSNAIRFEIVGDSFVLFTITQPTGGLINPTVDAALARVGNVWETLAVNALNIDDTTALDAYMNFGEARWDKLVRKPLAGVLSGNTTKLVGDATVISSARRSDRVNVQVVAPGSVNLPFVHAARQLARIAKVANDNPATDYGAQRVTNVLPGADGDQWDYTARDLAVKAGSSTIEVNDGVIEIGDIVTFYHPLGETPPAYRFVRDIVVIQNILFRVDRTFAAPAWAAAPLIPDDQPTVNPKARKPKSAVTEMYSIIDQLALDALISDPAFAKSNTTAFIDPQNPRRLNVQTIVKISGVTGVKDITLQWGFYFGVQAAA
jgi:phage tail sheath gpL-like